VLSTAVTARQTAIVRFSYPGALKPGEVLSLDAERRYDVTLTLDGVVLPALRFAPPLGDEEWRDVVDAIRTCTARDGVKDDGKIPRSLDRRAQEVRGAGRKLYRALADLNATLRSFLTLQTPRRLVIESDRAEIHALPWEALTDESWETTAAGGLSIVRCISAFNSIPHSAPSLLRVFAVAGPDVNRDTINALKSVEARTEAGRRVGIEIVTGDDPDAKVVHVVAHGSEHDGTIDLGPKDRISPEQLGRRFKNRLMVLLWSCFSGMVHSWDSSPAMGLHRSRNSFVLGFTAPLDFSSSKEIATEFYNNVFGAQGHQDPEAAIAAIRKSRFKGEKTFAFCDWASLTVWMQQPIDLTALPLGRLRIPDGNWNDRQLTENDELLRGYLQNDAALGDVSVLRSETVSPPLPRALVESWTGPVVHLHGPNALEQSSVFTQLAIDVSKCVHRADRFRVLLDKLTSYRFALLMWTDVGSNEVLLVHTLAPLPSNVALVLISPFTLSEAWPGCAIDGTTQGPEEQPPKTGVKAFLYLAGRDRFADALRLPRENTDDVEYWSSRYVACVKERDKNEAQACIDRIASIDRIEADLLRANLLTRDQKHLEAREIFLRTADRAREQERWRELARIQQEQAFLADKMGDRGLAEQLFESAIELLERPGERDSRWTSAIGRALRDYADLLASSGREEALPLLARATAIHALEGRITQVAYCRVTLSNLLCRLRRYDEADACAQEAAIVFDRAGNPNGWVDAVSLIATIATERNRSIQALSVLEAAITQRQAKAKRLSRGLNGRILLQMADIAWTSGRLAQGLAYARLAQRLLPSYQPEWRQARRLSEVIGGLSNSPSRVAALAGRMMQADDDFPLDELDRIRVKLAQAFMQHHIEVLVSSAARGADLLALDVAGGLGIDRTIVLPFSKERFQTTSVEPSAQAGWADLYGRILDGISPERLIQLDASGDAYASANQRILAHARTLAGAQRPIAFVVWDGCRQGERDHTADFRDSATASFDVVEITVDRS
jgi:tetratricopeptide (TPR) repeat protein